MTISYSLAPEPVWILINLVGTVAGGGYISTWESLNKVVQKPIFTDPGGLEPWPNPTYFDLNGVQGPFYWEFDSSDPDDTYFVQAFDAEGNLLWEVDGFSPGAGGGGGTVTEYLPLTNYIANNQFIDHISNTVNPVGVTNLVVAPSNHKGFTPALINPVITAYGMVSPDIIFTKNNTAATDQITFPLFPLGTAVLTGDVTPVDYVRYQCTNSPAGETYKAFQFPICQKVNNLSNQSMSFRIWAAVTATPVTLTVYTLQYYGSGTAATAPVQTAIGTITLTTTWTPYILNFTVPNVSGNSIGTVGMQTDDDALYIQLGMPLGNPCDVLFTKPALYLGTIDPTIEFEDYDQINSINSTPRTGDIRTSLSSSAPLGWVPMNDGSIGNVGSGATTRANADTFQLYKTLWDGVINTWAPVAGGRGATAIADFVANKALTLPLSLGRALANSGAGASLPTYVLGENEGAATSNALIAHTHTVPLGAGSASVLAGPNGINVVTAGPTTTSTAGSGSSFSILSPTSFMNVFIKL